MSTQVHSVAGLPGVKVTIESKSVRNRKTADIIVFRTPPVRGIGVDSLAPLGEPSYTAEALIGWLEAGPQEKARVLQEIDPMVRKLVGQGWKVNIDWSHGTGRQENNK